MDKEGDKVYHGSHKQGLGIIEPKLRDGRESVFATKDIVIAHFFIPRIRGNYICSFGRDIKLTKLPYIVERFEGAFESHYSVPGSIYEIPSEGFSDEGSNWPDEVLSAKSVIPLREIIIENVASCIKSLADEGKLILKYYADRGQLVPEDDRDLIKFFKKVAMSMGRDKALEKVEEYQPNLTERVRIALDNA